MAYYGNTPPPIQFSLPTPRLPAVANSNPFIPEDFAFWVSTDLHTIREYDPVTGDINTNNDVVGMLKSAIMGDVNFWIRGSGDPYLTNVDKLSSGIDEEHDFDGTLGLKENNPSLASNVPPENCRTCFESSGTVDSSFLNDFSQSVANHISRPLTNNYDHNHFWISSSRIETYGNRVPGTGIYSGSLTLDKIVYINGIATRVIHSNVHSDDSLFDNASPITSDPIGHYHYDRISSSIMPHSIRPHGSHAYRYGEGTTDQYYNAWLTMKKPSINHPGGAVYLEGTWHDYLGTGILGNGISSAMLASGLQAPMIVFRSSSGVPIPGVNSLFENHYLYSQGQTTGSVGYWDGGSGFPKAFARTIWYIENTQSFNAVFRVQDGTVNGKGAWPYVPLYFMTSSSVTTRANGDWMPEGLRTKAESLALALNFYGQFWGNTDVGYTNALSSTLDQFEGEGYQGGTLEKMAHSSVPYTWSVDSSDNLIYTSSLCSGSRIDHAHTGQMTFVKGHRSGAIFPGTASAHSWAANNPVNSGSVTWSSARGYTTFSGLMDEVGTYATYSGNFKEGGYNYERAYRFDYNNWRILGDTGVTASTVLNASRGNITLQPMLTGVSQSLKASGLSTGTSQSADPLKFMKSIGFITGSEKNTTGPEHLGLRFEKEFDQVDLRALGKNTIYHLSTAVGEGINPTITVNGLSSIMTDAQYAFHKTFSNDSANNYNGTKCGGSEPAGVPESTHTGTSGQANEPFGLVGDIKYNRVMFGGDGAGVEFGRYITWADTQPRFTKRSTCTCTEMFKWRSIPPDHNDFIYDLEFSDGFKFSTMAFTRLFMYNPTFLNQGTPLHPSLPTSQYWPHSLRAITPDELFNYTGSGVVNSNFSSPPVSTYKMNHEAGFVKCADIIPGTTRTNGYVYLKDIQRRKVTLKNPSHRSRYNSLQKDNRFNINKNNVECLFNASTSIDLFDFGSTPGTLDIQTAMQNAFDSNMIITSSTSTNNMYTGYVHANPEPWRGWYIQSQSLNGVNYTFTASAFDNAGSGAIVFNNTEGQTLSTISGNTAALSGSGGQLFYTYLEQHDAIQPGQYTPFTYAATTSYPRNFFNTTVPSGSSGAGSRSFNSGSIIYDGMLMLENGLYIGFEGPNCWTHDEYDLQSRNPMNREQGDTDGYPIGGGQYNNPHNFPGNTQRT